MIIILFDDNNSGENKTFSFHNGCAHCSANVPVLKCGHMTSVELEFQGFAFIFDTYLADIMGLNEFQPSPTRHRDTFPEIWSLLLENYGHFHDHILLHIVTVTFGSQARVPSHTLRTLGSNTRDKGQKLILRGGKTSISPCQAGKEHADLQAQMMQSPDSNRLPVVLCQRQQLALCLMKEMEKMACFKREIYLTSNTKADAAILVPFEFGTKSPSIKILTIFNDVHTQEE
jgi:hypothetical protein